MNYYCDVLVIGAGMSGLAASIRLAMYDREVVLVEKHTVPGGLNSFYSRKGRKIDVGLHALTNFARKTEKKKPLIKLLKQLRIKYDDLKLSEQSFSKIVSSKYELVFSNDFNIFKKSVEEKFPEELKNLESFIESIENIDETSLEGEYQSAREKLNSFFHNQNLIDMLMHPLLIYGSAWEMDMDYNQFIIMFKSIYLEGFSRPKGGVRTIIRLLLKRYKELGGVIQYGKTVKHLIPSEFGVDVYFTDGSKIFTKKVISSMGGAETDSLIANSFSKNIPKSYPVGQMTFTESILFFDKMPADYGINETIVFYNKNDKYKYERPQDFVDYSSAVICLPNNFIENELDEGIIRITFIANYDKWKSLNEEEYRKQKEIILNKSLDLIKKYFPQFKGNLNFHDIFTPLTIERYTGHFNGCVYGSTQKVKNGETAYPNLYLCGTDQGFLGIVGSLLSGISMANLHILQKKLLKKKTANHIQELR